MRYFKKKGPVQAAKSFDDDGDIFWGGFSNPHIVMDDNGVGEDVFTGLLDADGEPIFRAGEQIGFLVDYGEGLKPRYYYED